MVLFRKVASWLCRHTSTTKNIQRCSLSSYLSGTVDRYNGVTINVPDFVPPSTPADDFHKLLKDSVDQWKEEKRIAVWLRVPIHYSRYIEVAAQHGFVYHHAEHSECLLKLWLGTREDSTPRFATHQVGVCGVVLRPDTNALLVMREKKSQYNHYWKFPGGLADLGEDFGEAAVRETYEETGIRAEFASVLAFRQQHNHPMAFGRSDLYVVCRLIPETFDLVPCHHEVLDCQWIPIEEVQKNIQITSITHRLVMLMVQGIQNGFDSVDITFEEMQSVYKGLKFHLYHRPLGTELR